MERLASGAMKADCAPTKGSQIIIDKVEHLIVRANNLTSTAAGLSTFMLGPKPAAPRPEAEKKTGSFAEEVLARLDELSHVIGEAQDHLNELRSQF